MRLLALLPPPAAVLFGLRTATSGLLALYIAFALQIDQPAWAGTSAIIVAQPVLGASLRKGTFRLIGTLTGAVFAVLLYAVAPQDRAVFLLGLALWGAACSFVSTFLSELTSYAAMLAGYTAAIIAMDAVGSPNDVFLLAAARASAITIGVICTTLVFSLTDFGSQRQALATKLEDLAAQALDGIRGVLTDAAALSLDQQRDRRRALVAEAAALETVVEQAAGENYDLRSRQGGLRAAVAGLFAMLSCWRGMEQHIRRLQPSELIATEPARRRLAHVLVEQKTAVDARASSAALIAEPTGGVSQRLFTDRLGEVLTGLANAQEGITLLRDPIHAPVPAGYGRIQLSDPLAAAVNAARAFIVVSVAILIWLASAWSAGPVFVTFTMVVVLVYVLRNEAAFGGASMMAAGSALALLVGGIVKFAILPLLQGWGFETYATFAAVVGGFVCLAAIAAAGLPQGTMAAGIAFATMANFVPLFSPTNEITYDYAGFLNTAIGIIAGATLGAAGYRLIPPLSPELRTRRLIAHARGDLMQLVRGRWRLSPLQWQRRSYTRLVQLPPQATLLQHGQVLAALSVGRELLNVRRLARADTTDQDHQFRLRAARLEIAEAVASHPDFFAGLGVERV